MNKLFLLGVSLGNSWEFRPIWALEISADPESTRPTVPKIRYVAGVHGNAAAGPELLLEFASVLCINYGGNPTITKVGVTSLQLFKSFYGATEKRLPCCPEIANSNPDDATAIHDQEFKRGNGPCCLGGRYSILSLP